MTIPKLPLYRSDYRIGENLKGIKDADEDEIFVQAQYVSDLPGH